MILYCIHKSMPLYPTLSQLNSVYTLAAYFLKNQFNIIINLHVSFQSGSQLHATRPTYHVITLIKTDDEYNKTTSATLKVLKYCMVIDFTKMCNIC